MLLDLFGFVFAVADQGVFGVHVGNRQLRHGEQFCGGGVGLGEGFVGNDALVVDGESVVFTVGRGGVLVFGVGAGRHLQPDDVFAGHEFAGHPIRCPSVVKHGLAFFITGDGVGNNRGVLALFVGDAVAQFVGVELVFDGRFAAPACLAAGEVGFAVAVGVEQFGDGGIFKLPKVGDFVLVGSFFVA